MPTLRNQWGDAPWDRTGSISVGDLRDIPKRPEVAIIGAGLTGLSVAYHLAKLGVLSVVLEAAKVADGASGRTGGLVLEGTAVGTLPSVDTCVAGLSKLVAAEQIECGLHLPGCWEIEHRRESSSSSTTDPSILPWTDAGKRIAIAKLVAGGTVEPARLTLGLARAAVVAGASIYETARVTDIRINRPSEKPSANSAAMHNPAVGSGDEISRPSDLSISIAGEVLHPRWVVIACNAWLGALLPMPSSTPSNEPQRLRSDSLSVSVSDTPSISSCLTFACATEPVSESQLREVGLDERIPFYTSDRPYLWGRVTDDRRIIFGSGLVFAAAQDLEEIVSSSRDFRLEIDSLHTRVRKLHPVFANIKFSNSWAGPIAFTEDAVPLLGVSPLCERILVAGAYAGHGVALSVRAGELIARAIALNEALPAWGKFDR
jgi:gamma-glutamylputrescine oxidase